MREKEKEMTEPIAITLLIGSVVIIGVCIYLIGKLEEAMKDDACV